MSIRKGMLLMCCLSLCFLSGCASKTVQRVDVKEQLDLSGRWNDTDARLVAEEMIRDCLSLRWDQQFRDDFQRKPVVVIGPIMNNSHEHINADVFTKSLERQLLRSGRADIVASRIEREPVREERTDQHRGLTDPESIKAFGKETGADFIVIGSVNSVKDEYRHRYIILYQVSLELVDVESNQKVWIGMHMLKKDVSRSKYSL